MLSHLFMYVTVIPSAFLVTLHCALQCESSDGSLTQKLNEKMNYLPIKDMLYKKCSKLFLYAPTHVSKQRLKLVCVLVNILGICRISLAAEKNMLLKICCIDNRHSVLILLHTPPNKKVQRVHIQISCWPMYRSISSYPPFQKVGWLVPLCMKNIWA